MRRGYARTPNPQRKTEGKTMSPIQTTLCAPAVRFSLKGALLALSTPHGRHRMFVDIYSR